MKVIALGDPKIKNMEYNNRNWMYIKYNQKGGPKNPYPRKRARSIIFDRNIIIQCKI